MSYNTRCSLEFNGAVYEDFTGFSENSASLAIQVPLMNKTGTAKVMPRYGFSVDSVQSNVPASVNLRAIFEGTFTVEYENGDRVDFGGVATAETGDKSTDGESPTANSISFIAETRTPDLELKSNG